MNIIDTALIYILISALIKVESNGDVNAYNKEEDAVGCLQIRPIYVQDLNRFSTKTWTHDQMYDEAEARLAVAEYLRYYGNQIRRIELREPTFEDLARIYNGGEMGYCRDSTLPYWKKVRVELEKLLPDFNN